MNSKTRRKDRDQLPPATQEEISDIISEPHVSQKNLIPRNKRQKAANMGLLELRKPAIIKEVATVSHIECERNVYTIGLQTSRPNPKYLTTRNYIIPFIEDLSPEHQTLLQ